MCPVCESTDYTAIRNYRSDKKIFQQMVLVRCNFCSMVYANPMPDEETLTAYNANYFTAAHSGLNTNLISVIFFSAIAWIRMHHVERYIRKVGLSIKRVLEIGPGTGYFARNWLSIYPATQYFAVETDASCHASLRQSGVALTELAPAPEKKDQYDLVVLSHVLEHVSRPKEFLATISTSLRKGGIFFIEVPCLDWQHKSEDEPHLLFFEKKSMLHLLTSLGCTNIQLSYHGETIKNLKRNFFVKYIAGKLRMKLLQMGLVKILASFYKGDRQYMNLAELAVVDPYQAHVESEEPAWWLRAIAVWP